MVISSFKIFFNNFEDSKKDFFNGIGYSNNFDNIRNAKYESSSCLIESSFNMKLLILVR